ncbi:tetratricopeptide repeat protein [Patescibacteria group bacterium]
MQRLGEAADVIDNEKAYGQAMGKAVSCFSESVVCFEGLPDIDDGVRRQLHAAHYQLANAYYHLQDYQEAMSCVNTALAYWPNNPRSVGLRACIRIKASEKNLAIKELQKVCRSSKVKSSCAWSDEIQETGIMSSCPKVLFSENINH